MASWIHSLTVVDWVLLAVVLASAIAGLLRGIIRAVFSLAGLVLGVVLAGWYCERAGAAMQRWISSPLAARAVAFFLILLVIYVAAELLGRLARGAASVVGLGFADRAAGAGFGLLRAYVALAALLIPLAPYVVETEAAKTSVLLPYFLSGAHGISFVLPQDLKQQIAAGIQKLDARR